MGGPNNGILKRGLVTINVVDFQHCCPCGGKLQVIDSRKEYYGVRRRRRCVECGDRFSTVEIEADSLDRAEGLSVVNVIGLSDRDRIVIGMW